MNTTTTQYRLADLATIQADFPNYGDETIGEKISRLIDHQVIVHFFDYSGEYMINTATADSYLEWQANILLSMAG